MGILNKLFKGNYSEAAELLKQGAMIIDVRSVTEFKLGHNQGSINIPLNELTEKKDEIFAMDKSVVFCCASGVRSEKATIQFKEFGLTCENGGGWRKVQGMMKK